MAGDRAVTRFAAVAVVAILVGPIPAAQAQQAAFTESGNYYLPGCQSLISVSRSDLARNFQAGQCLGAITVLQTWFKGVGATCMPSWVTVRQIIRVVVKYMNDHPDRLHEDFLNVAGPAIHDAWPCPQGAGQ